MYETVLIADRGFLAVRVIHSCQQAGIKAVVLVRPGDETAPYVHAADEAVPFAAPRPVEAGSADGGWADLGAALVEAAQVSGAQAVHPGGSLPVRVHDLADIVRAAGLAWLGPVTDAALGRLSDGEVGVTLVAGRVADGWRWLVRGSERPSMAVSWTPPPGLVALAESVVDGRWQVASLAARGGPASDATEPWPPERIVALRPALAGVDRLVEARTGVDLVARQLGVDDGLPVPAATGYAVSLALFARPGEPAGAVSGWSPPEVDAVVVDTVLDEGREFASWSGDPLATLTARGADAEQAWAALRAAVDGLELQTPDVGLAAVRAMVHAPPVV